MAYTVEISSTAYRLAKKLPKNIRQVVVDHAKKLAIKPHAGEKLKGKYSYLLTGDCQIPILGTALVAWVGNPHTQVPMDPSGLHPT